MILNKKQMTEEDIKLNFITPALNDAGWQNGAHITMETQITDGKINLRGNFVTREKPKKVLFLVHREQIAKQAMASYKRVFGNTKTFGLLSGNSKDYDADNLFATMQMMAKDETLRHFRPNTFSTIIIDDYGIIGLSQKAA